MTPPVIHRIATLEMDVQPWSWPFAGERRVDIDTYFDLQRKEKPKIWNGRVVLARHPEFGAEHFSATCFEADFASFLAWRDWGFPDRDIFNVFGMGALRGSDGTFILGEMASHTANAGRVYFPSGTPDLNDIRSGMVDIAGSIAREVEEETGLTPEDYRSSPHWDCVMSGTAIAIIKVLDVDLRGDELRAVIEANLAQQQQPELAAIHLVGGPSDFTPAMPRFVTAFIEAHFAGPS